MSRLNEAGIVKRVRSKKGSDEKGKRVEKSKKGRAEKSGTMEENVDRMEKPLTPPST